MEVCNPLRMLSKGETAEEEEEDPVTPPRRPPRSPRSSTAGAAAVGAADAKDAKEKAMARAVVNREAIIVLDWVERRLVSG